MIINVTKYPEVSKLCEGLDVREKLEVYQVVEQAAKELYMHTCGLPAIVNRLTPASYKQVGVFSVRMNMLHPGSSADWEGISRLAADAGRSLVDLKNDLNEEGRKARSITRS